MGNQKFQKPSAIIFDISGTAIKDAFIEKILMPYIRSNIEWYVKEGWNKPEVVKDVERLRKQNAKDLAEGLDCAKVADAGAEIGDQQTSLIEYVMWNSERKRETSAYTRFRFNMWFDGYHKGKISTPVYSDVVFQLKKWRFNMQIKLYVYSNGWTEATKRFLQKTNHGDLTNLIDGFFDTAIGKLNDSQSYQKILDKIGIPADQVYFLTKSGEEARAANQVGIKPILVLTHRKNIEKLEEQDKVFSKVRTFNELEFE